MTLTYKYITVRVFDDPSIMHPGPKPIYMIVNNAAGTDLGAILWYPAWRRRVCVFEENAVFSADCLADIQDAIQKITEGEK